MKYKGHDIAQVLSFQISIERPRMNPSIVCVRRVVNKVAMKHDFLCTNHSPC